jgi:predicted AlkP superfamily pyrophosphatase or phosphodiesterase
MLQQHPPPKKVMKRKLLFLVALLLSFSIFSHAQIRPVRDLKPTVILISLDGFRYDYLDKYPSPTLNKLAKKGVRAKWMTPSFPTKTFPNHYTIATGLFPANNGIVENNIYDFGVRFSMSNREEVQKSRWWLGEPIWVTTEKQGQISASYFFPGTEAPIGGKQPTVWRGYNGDVPPQMRVDKLLEWFDLPAEKRPTMMTLYFSDVDDAGHEFSPDAEETKYAVWNVDGYIQRLMDGLKKRKIDKKVNLIIVSDHGMASVYPKNAVYLDDYFDLETADPILYAGEIVQIFPKPGMLNEIHTKLKDIKHSKCWKKAEIPARLNYSGSNRIAPIVCSADEGWNVTNRKRQGDWIKNLDNADRPRGAHGYDHELESMRAIFIGHGAAFPKGKVIEPFQNIHVYNLMTRILGLQPAKNDGDMRLAEAALKR